VGCPPDLVFTKGQDWGFPPLHPQKLRESGYRHFIEVLQHHLREAGLLRLDHVMGLHRLFWIPQGFPASEGLYVRYPAQELNAILCIESHRHRARIVGENLGTVPPSVNSSMARHRVREMFVVQYELKPEANKALRSIPSRSVASINTHDMPPFKAFWDELDIRDRSDLGLINKHEIKQESTQRKALLRALIRFLIRGGWLSKNKLDAATVLRACLSYLSASAAEMVLVNLEDLWLETASQNVPGTSLERPNWRRKARLSLQEICRSPQISAILNAIDVIRKRKKVCGLDEAVAAHRDSRERLSSRGSGTNPTGTNRIV
jgi:4-alpha-glucanotransferase